MDSRGMTSFEAAKATTHSTAGWATIGCGARKEPTPSLGDGATMLPGVDPVKIDCWVTKETIASLEILKMTSLMVVQETMF
jgi:hypothetical protein